MPQVALQDHKGTPRVNCIAEAASYGTEMLFLPQAIVVCLDSKDYVQIRNSLIILIKILPHFPVLAKLSQILERKVEKVREEERGQRQDLHVLATSYSGQLKAKTPNMIREADFHHVGDKVRGLLVSTAREMVR